LFLRVSACEETNDPNANGMSCQSGLWQTLSRCRIGHAFDRHSMLAALCAPRHAIQVFCYSDAANSGLGVLGFVDCGTATLQSYRRFCQILPTGQFSSDSRKVRGSTAPLLVQGSTISSGAPLQVQGSTTRPRLHYQLRYTPKTLLSERAFVRSRTTPKLHSCCSHGLIGHLLFAHVPPRLCSGHRWPCANTDIDAGIAETWKTRAMKASMTCRSSQASGRHAVDVIR